MQNVSAMLLVTTMMLPQLENVLIVDARPEAEYTKGHIPGAVSLPAEELSEKRDGVENLLKPAGEVRAMLAQTGIDPGKHIVVYSGMYEVPDIRDATRVFWVLEHFGYDRVSVLDGGFAKWRREQRPMERGKPEPHPIELPDRIQPNPDRIATIDEVSAALEGSGVVLDIRPKPFYTGEEKSDFVKKRGHIEGAKNVPMTGYLEPAERLFRSVDDLKKQFGDAGAAENREVITYCNSGRAASVGYFVGRLIGLEDLELYDGSMAEWSREKPRKIKKD